MNVAIRAKLVLISEYWKWFQFSCWLFRYAALSGWWYYVCCFVQLFFFCL